MAPDDRGAERKAKTPAPAPAERTDLFEEFQRPSQPGDPPKPKGLNAAGYKFPPEGPVAMTKENIAKGLTTPRATHASLKGAPSTPAGPPAPLPELKDANSMFETYERPDLEKHPRTGPGLRPPAPKPGPQPKSAKEILAGYNPPEPQVFTPKRERAPSSSPPHEAEDTVEHDAAHLDAEADLAATKGAVMSHSRRHGPTKVLTNEDPFLEMPTLPGDKPVDDAVVAPMGSPSISQLPPTKLSPAPIASTAPKPMAHQAAAAPTVHTPAPTPMHAPRSTLAATAPPTTAPPTTAPRASTPHVSDAPRTAPGDGPRIGLIQADFNIELTTKMAIEAKAAAKELGSTITHHIHAPGVYDLPLLAKALAKRGDVDAIVVVGCVIQGETAHDEVIATECARKLADLAFDTEKPVGFAVSGPRMTKQEAEARVPMARHAVESAIKQWRTLKALAAARHHE